MSITFSEDKMPPRQDTVLIIEDDPDIVEILSLYLGGSGYGVLTALDGRAGVSALTQSDISLVLVDLMMPSMNGFDFINEARTFSNVPIIIVSARSQLSDKMLGLDLGADGFIAKPFDPLEVLAYVKAMLRRCSSAGLNSPMESSSSFDVNPGGSGQQFIRVGDLELDKEKISLRKCDAVISLTASEFKILLKMMQSPGRVFTKAQLYECISGNLYSGGDSVMVHISNIRSKIEDDPGNPRYIITVRGLGYRFGA